MKIINIIIIVLALCILYLITILFDVFTNHTDNFTNTVKCNKDESVDSIDSTNSIESVDLDIIKKESYDVQLNPIIPKEKIVTLTPVRTYIDMPGYMGYNIELIDKYEKANVSSGLIKENEIFKPKNALLNTFYKK